MWKTRCQRRSSSPKGMAFTTSLTHRARMEQTTASPVIRLNTFSLVTFVSLTSQRTQSSLVATLFCFYAILKLFVPRKGVLKVKPSLHLANVYKYSSKECLKRSEKNTHCSKGLLCAGKQTHRGQRCALLLGHSFSTVVCTYLYKKKKTWRWWGGV